VQAKEEMTKEGKKRRDGRRKQRRAKFTKYE